MSQSAIVIDTTLFPGVVAVLTEQRGGKYRIDEWHVNHVRAGSIVQLTRNFAASWATLEGAPARLYVSVGPGSFTGIKLGLAFVEGLECGDKSRISMVPFSALQVLAIALSKSFNRCLVFHRATATKGYFAEAGFGCLGSCVGVVDVDSEGIWLSAFGWKSVREPLAALGNRAIVLAGEWSELKQAIEATIDLRLTTLCAQDLPEKMIQGLMQEREGLPGARVDCRPIKPLYLRPSSPEEKMARSQEVKVNEA